MKRVMVIGSCGAGKSTFSKKLNEILKTELIHLDQQYWQPNWVETEKQVWEQKVRQLAEKPHWIIDGNYGGTMDIRIKRADTIIYLDFPTWKCLWRIIKRTTKYWHKSRPDMPEGCHERFDLEFFHYVLVFNFIKRKSLHKKLQKVSSEKEVHILYNDKEVSQFLSSLSAAI